MRDPRSAPRPRPRVPLAARGAPPALATALAAALALAPAAPRAARAQPRPAPAPAAAPRPGLDSATLATFRWRNVGPAIMGGRVTDIEADPRDPKTFYVATAAGGIWKTINHGTTFTPLFQREAVVSMGDIAVAPSDPRVLYAGTGEEDTRNSISPGGGVYRSADGGQTWQYVGLRETQQIGRVVVHPRDPNTVYVAALGHAWGPNRERGVYKTVDGGRSWALVKFVSERAGFVDLAMDPTDPDVLWAASWERVRGPHFLRSGGPGSGLWRSGDAGRTWTEVRGGGFPAQAKGRIGLAIAPSDARVMYAMIEADTLPNPRRGPPERAPEGEPTIGYGGTVPNAKNQSGLYRSADGGRTWALMQRNESDARPFYYSQVRVDPKDPNRVYWMSSVFRWSEDGGKTVKRGAQGVHTDWHALWIDPADPSHLIHGNDGGVYVTWDRGGTYDFLNTMPLGQFYAVSFDLQVPYRVCGGLQDNGSWCGPSRTRMARGATNAEWFNVGGGDGFHTAQDPEDPNTIYAESQGGVLSRLDLATGVRTVLQRGRPRGRGAFEDSLVVAQGDTALPPADTTARRLARLRALQRADTSSRMRFNWQMPFFLSPHSPRVLYAAGNRVLRSTDRGERLVPISPDLSTRDSARIRTSLYATGGLTPDNTGAETHGTVTTLAESPVRPGILWAGTDDGNVWVTRDDGGAWENVTGRFPGLPPRTWVSRVEPSHHDSATVYVTFDGHRTDDFAPHVYVSADFGRTFRRIVDGLPADGGPHFVHVIREDPHDRDLLFLGTDVGAYVSTDRGARWRRFMADLPTVPVHDLKIHPRDRELIAGTHGRSIWIADIGPLEQLVDSVLARPVAFLQPKTAHQYAVAPEQHWAGHKLWQAQNPPYGVELVYRVAGGAAPAAGDSARLVVTRIGGDTVRVLRGPAGAGLHRVRWDLRGTPTPLGPAARRDSVLAERRRQARADSTRAALARAGGDTTEAGRALATLRSGSDSAKAALAERARRDTAFHRAVLARLQALPDSERAPLMREGAALLARAGGGAAATTPSLRPGEAAGDPDDEAPGRRRRQGAQVAPGEYLVTLTVGGQTLRRTVTVERLTPIVEGNPFGEADGEEEHEEP